MDHVRFYQKEYPRPQLFRSGYQLLNGQWDFAFGQETEPDEVRCGGFTGEKILVPYVYQTPASGIDRQDRQDIVWYSRQVELTQAQLEGRVLLHFEGNDYETTLWVNGSKVGSDTGAYHRLSFDCTEFLRPGTNTLTVKITDDYSTEKPRGKQRWKDESFECWYVDTTGIYKTVWLEFVPRTYITALRIEPDRLGESVSLSWQTNQPSDLQAEIRITFAGHTVATARVSANAQHCRLKLTENLPLQLWEVGKGRLYEFSLSLCRDTQAVDTVHSYFGVRDITIEGSRIFLNGKPLYQKLILDQGYWKDTHLTAPSEEAILKDITDMITMGFNGARKHQKVDDERALYYADILGYIIWAEMPSMYENTPRSRAVFEREWLLSLEQQRNHPCVLVWVPLNESWGVREIAYDKTQQNFANEMYHKTKAADPTRPVISNDGWEHTLSDIVTIHEYLQDGDVIHDKYDTVEKCCTAIYSDYKKTTFAQGYGYHGQPIMFSEFGGTAFLTDAVGENWGYGQAVTDQEEFLKRFRSLITAIDTLPFSCGYCYTQLTDVQQEVNGLEDVDHNPKFDTAAIREILEACGR